ncbi:replication protein A 70 kDa DNA-binding subunit D [Capsicum galapagoense]
MTTEDIFDTTCVKLQLLRLDHIHQMLSDKLFNIQLKKSSWVSANLTRTSLTIVSFTEKEQLLPLTIDQRNAKKVRPLATSELGMEPTIVESGSSSAALALEPLTPAKKTKRPQPKALLGDTKETLKDAGYKSDDDNWDFIDVELPYK